MLIQVRYDFSEDEIQALIRYAIINCHYNRDNPKSVWRNREKKEAVRLATEHIIKKEI
jgi:hypothetical protein